MRGGRQERQGGVEKARKDADDSGGGEGGGEGG